MNDKWNKEFRKIIYAYNQRKDNVLGYVDTDLMNELESFIQSEIRTAKEEERKKVVNEIKNMFNPEYPNLTPVEQKTREWYKIHEANGAEIVFYETEDLDGVVRKNPIKAIYQSPLAKFKEVISLK